MMIHEIILSPYLEFAYGLLNPPNPDNIETPENNQISEPSNPTIPITISITNCVLAPPALNQSSN